MKVERLNSEGPRRASFLVVLISLLSLTFLSACKSGSTAFSDIIGSADGGTGNASIAINSFSPGASSFTIKSEATQAFLVSAVGKGTLTYVWTLDDVEVGSNLPNFTINASLLTVGERVLKVTIRDEVGSVSQTWNVKINGTPVIASATPDLSTVLVRRLTVQNYSVTVTDPNSDTLTYVWKLNGQEGVLTSTTAAQSWTPVVTEVGSHTVSVDIYDGPASDLGTYKVTRSWVTRVNNYSIPCNRLENESQTNKACILVGLGGVGDGSNPDSSPSDFLIRPSALKFTPEGNLFVGDDENHVVWLWNRYTSPSMTVGGVVVPINTMKVVAGAGYPSSGNSASLKSLRQFLNNPLGLEWDGTYLYISDTSNDRVIRVNAAGDIETVNSAGCLNPRGLARSGTQLYIACYSSHVIRVVNTTTLVGATFAGTGGAGDPTLSAQASFTHATEGRLRNPHSVALDSAGDLFVSEYGGCRIRAYNINTVAGKQIYGAGWTLSQNTQRIVVGAAGGANCGTYTVGEAVNLDGMATDARIRQVRGISFAPSGELLMTGDNMHRVIALNFNAGSSSLLGQTIAGFSINTLIGSGSTAYTGEGQLARVTNINQPYDVAVDPITGDYFVASRDQRRLRRIGGTDFRASLQAGNGSYRNLFNTGQGTVEAGLEKMNQPRGFTEDSVTGQIFVADSANHRIRVINRFGEVTQAVGSGTSGAGGEEDELPTNTTMNQPRGLALTNATATFGGHLVWADSQNHRVRIWNRESVSRVLFGVTVPGGMVATIGGNGSAGTVTTGPATAAAVFNEPSGVAYDGTNLYVADRNNACIKRIAADGTLSVAGGTCGTTGNVNGGIGAARMTQPEGLVYYSHGGHTGIIIAATGNGRVKFLRLAGPSTLLFGTAIPIGDTNNVACGGTFHTEGVGAGLIPCSGVYDVAASGGKFCFTNNGYHNVRCVDPTGATTTAIGAVQGIDDSTPMYFPRAPFASAAFDATAPFPNYNSQDGVTAFFLPSPLVSATDQPSNTQDFATLVYPRGVHMIDERTLLVSDLTGVIRKVKLP